MNKKTSGKNLELPPLKGLLNALFAIENFAFPSHDKTAQLPLPEKDRDALADALRPVLIKSLNADKGHYEISEDGNKALQRTKVIRQHHREIMQIEQILERTGHLDTDLSEQWRFKVQGIKLTTPRSVINAIREQVNFDTKMSETPSLENAG